jgi:predicted Fe-Mo cluster-binding NifX family protein
MIVAVPTFDEAIAPRFEVARRFLIVRLEGGKELSSKLIDCAGCEGFGRVRLLREHDVDVLICNGIKSFYRDLLAASEITVIPNVTLPAHEALRQFADGQLQPVAVSAADSSALLDKIPHEDLVCWAKELFEAHGYRVSVAADRAPFPIDLVAEILCPVCQKPVRVAICCGSHTYRSEQEIRQLHRVAVADYHAQVYVHPGSPPIQTCCRQYGIELIDPDAELAGPKRLTGNAIPVLRGPVSGHDRASAQGRV